MTKKGEGERGKGEADSPLDHGPGDLRLLDGCEAVVAVVVFFAVVSSASHRRCVLQARLVPQLRDLVALNVVDRCRGHSRELDVGRGRRLAGESRPAFVLRCSRAHAIYAGLADRLG